MEWCWQAHLRPDSFKRNDWKVLDVPLVRPVLQPDSNGPTEDQHLCIFAPARVLEDVPSVDLGHRRGSRCLERHLPLRYPAWRVRIGCKALGSNVERPLLES